MRVAVVGPLAPLRGGIAAHTRGLHDALVHSGHEATVVSYRRLYPSCLFPGTRQVTLDADGAPSVTAGANGALIDTLSPASWLRARRRILEFEPDLVVGEWWHPGNAPVLTACSLGLPHTKVAYVCHNAHPHEAFPAARSISRLALRHLDGVVCHSRWVADQLTALGVKAPVETVPMPLLLNPARNPYARGETRKRLGLEPGQKAVMFLGIVRPYKGVDVLLRAWELTRAAHRHRLVIAGESYLRRGRLQQLVRSLDNEKSIIVAERYMTDEELIGMVDAADLLVLPYVNASQSGLLPVALASGVTTIVSDAGGLGEALDGCNGRARVVPAGDWTSLAAAIDEVLENAPDAPRQARAWPAGEADPGESWAPLLEALQRLTRHLS